MIESGKSINSFFVYGTLKRGLRNECVWPTKPIQIWEAWISGQLYERSDYPALKEGIDRVLGEVWLFEDEDVEPVTRALDLLEGTNGNGANDLYHRISVEPFSLTERPTITAWTYRYVGNPIDHGFRRMYPCENEGYVVWPAAS